MAQPEAWLRHFGGVLLFRKSLETRKQAEAMRLGADAHQEFERRSALILGEYAPTIEEDDNATRPLTAEALQKMREQAREMVVRPWARQMVLSELGGKHSDELERLMYQREEDAELLREILKSPGAAQPDPRLQPYLSDPRLPDIAGHVGSADRP